MIEAKQFTFAKAVSMSSQHSLAHRGGVGFNVPAIVPALHAARVPSSNNNSTPRSLISLATLATSMYQHETERRQMKRIAIKPPSTPPPLRPTVHAPPRQPPPSVASASAIRIIRVVLQRPAGSTAWGLTLSMLDSSCLVLGYVDRSLVDRYTDFAARSWNFSHPVVTARPGDIIRSINGRSIDSFPNFLALTQYLKHNFYVSMEIVRALDLPLRLRVNASPGSAYSIAEQAFRWIFPQLKILAIRSKPKKLSKEGSLKVTKVARKWQPKLKSTPKALPFLYTNPLFHDAAGKAIQYADDFDSNPEDGSRASQFLVPVDDFQSWLTERKKTWRQNWKPYQLEDAAEDVENDPPTSVAKDFWSSQSFGSFEQWRRERKTAWQREYSWNRQKKRRIEQVAEQVVHFSPSCGTEEQFREWLRVRKSQWGILRVKRQRRLEQQFRKSEDVALSIPVQTGDNVGESDIGHAVPSVLARRQTTGDMLLIDSLLDEQERKRQAHLETFDLAFVFDAKLGAPDDVIAHCFRYLHPSEHGKLLCVSATSSKAIMERDEMWRQLCPTHWILPRRPRKRWYDLYISKMRKEVQASRKQSDDLLSRIASVLFKGDHLHKVEKLVTDGQTKFDFDVNYHSGIVCERNSMLNLAVINGRLKVVRWLVESKGADIESCDRGGFTPLINAAWDGNIKTVRFLLSKGCDRAKIGTGHYTKPLALPDFEGYNAADWAQERGHQEVSDRIRIGL